MKKYKLYEDKRPPKLFVAFAPNISNEIERIDDYNQGNIPAIEQWHNYIAGLISYISNPVIALDYTNKYNHFPNGAVYLNELGYEVCFYTSPHKVTNKYYVYVFKLNLKPEEFGLKIPNSIPENYTHPKEISVDTIYRIMSEQYERYLYSLF